MSAVFCETPLKIQKRKCIEGSSEIEHQDFLRCKAFEILILFQLFLLSNFHENTGFPQIIGFCWNYQPTLVKSPLNLLFGSAVERIEFCSTVILCFLPVLNHFRNYSLQAIWIFKTHLNSRLWGCTASPSASPLFALLLSSEALIYPALCTFRATSPWPLPLPAALPRRQSHVGLIHPGSFLCRQPCSCLSKHFSPWVSIHLISSDFRFISKMFMKALSSIRSWTKSWRDH